MGNPWPVTLLLSCFVLTASLQTTEAVDYQVINTAASTPGGIRFNNDVGIPYARKTLASATGFIWNIFQQNAPGADRKNVEQVTLFVESISGIAETSGNQINLSAIYVNEYSGDVRREVTGVLYHQMTHVWQWNGTDQANACLIEGIADYVRLKGGYAPSHWVKPGQGDRWDQGYDVTARFLDYCNSLRNGFMAQLNAKLKNGYSVTYFNDLLGKSVDQLWSDYKAKYNAH